MFEDILTVIYISIDICFYGFLYSFKIGKFLVSVVTILLDVSCIVFQNLCDLLCVIFDSFEIFLQDILELVQSVFGLGIGIWNTIGYALFRLETFYNSFDQCLLAVYISSVYRSWRSCISNVVEGSRLFCILLKHISVLFGSGVYFTITFIPFNIWKVFRLLVDILDNLHEYIVWIKIGSVQFAKDCATDFYDFLTDVPVESAVGILIAASLIFLFARFYAIIFSYLFNNTKTHLLKMYYKIFRRRQQSDQRGQKYPSRKLQAKDAVGSSKDAYTDERYCVICQEQLKCILVLPCRHVCMCSECNSKLQMYHKTCPICRHDIESTMKIFL